MDDVISLAALRVIALDCVRCPLAAGRTQVVFGDGDPNADLMLVGEAPGRDEDVQGRPFLGAAGRKLDEFLAGIDRRRADVYIANVVMCRPPRNRPPRQSEVRECAPYLDSQIRLVGPKVVIALGARPTKRLLGREATLAGSRGREHRVGDLVVIATYHPSPLSLNRAPERYDQVRADFNRAAQLLAESR